MSRSVAFLVRRSDICQFIYVSPNNSVSKQQRWVNTRGSCNHSGYLMSNTTSDCGPAAKADLPALSYWSPMAEALASIKSTHGSLFFIYLLFTRSLLTLISNQCYLTLLEVQFLESEVSLHNASGLNPGSQHILLGGDVVCFGYPLQVI